MHVVCSYCWSEPVQVFKWAILYRKPMKSMNALTVQNPLHKCDWETGMTTDKKIVADCNNDYYTEIIIIILKILYRCLCVLQLTL